MKHKHSGFTMLELIIVIGIVLVIMVTMRNIFKTEQRDMMYGESCINKVYGEINNFIYAGISSKSIFTGNIKIYPETYSIQILPSKNTIELQYSTGGANKTYKVYELTGTALKPFYCSTNTYYIQLTGKNTTITINKQQIQDQNLPLFMLSGATSLFSGEYITRICYNPTYCKEIIKLKVSTATQSIRKQSCVQRSAQGDTCLIRNE